MLKFIDFDRKVQKQLQQLNLTRGGWVFKTSFQQLMPIISQQIVKYNQIPQYLRIMKRIQLTPDLLLKHTVVIHIHMQEKSGGHQQLFIQYLSYLLDACAYQIQFYISQENMKQNSITGRSVINRSSTTRSQQIFMSKQIFLLTAIVKPYLSYCLKIVSSLDDFSKIGKDDEVEFHQAWMMINLMKSIGSITCNFTMIGRYYMKNYGNLIVLITHVLARDINHFNSLIKNYIKAENYKIRCENVKSEDIAFKVEQFIKMLQEIAGLNDQLITVFLGKYFYDFVKELKEPKWIDTNSSEFDSVFRLWKNINQNYQPEKKQKRRALSQTKVKPSFKKSIMLTQI